MKNTVSEKLNWFGILKMSGLMISEIIYREYFKKQPPISGKEHFTLRKILNRFNSGSYSVNNLVKNLFFELLNHNPERWLTEKDARSYSRIEHEHNEKLYPDFVLPSKEKDKPAFVIKTLGENESLDKRKPSGSGTWRASEHIKFESLLRLLNCPLGLLTNGKEFRLFYAEEGHSAAYLSWNQNDWIEEQSTFEAFRNLLNKDMLLPDTKKGIYKLIKESHEKQAEVTDALADQVFTVINIILDYVNQSKLNIDPDKIYEAVIKVVMRLVFILYAEENNLLPHGFPEYDDNYGLIHLANALETERSNLGSDFETKASYRYDAWYRILALFNLIYYGSDHPELKITKHGGDLFSPEAVNQIFEEAKISNKGVRDILYNLLYMKGLRLSYAAIDVEQIGYVYEGLLGYTISTAKEDLVVTIGEKFVLPLRELEKRNPKEIKDLMKNVDKKAAKKVPERFPEPESDTLQARAAKYAAILAPEEERIISEGSYYMSASGARKSTGSYYTPKPLTSYLVKETLMPLCADENGKVKSSSKILSLKVVDPAMGSGAFLVQATDYLSDKLLKAWENEGINTEISDAEREILAKRNIVEHCIYGVDINPIAVELAKMSLWLNTFSKDKPFTFLDHKLKCGNSLIGVYHGLDNIDVIPKEVYKTSKNMSKEWKSQIASLRKLNQKYKPEKKGNLTKNQSSFLSAAEILDENFKNITTDLSTVSQQIDVTGKETEDYFAKQQIYREQFLENKEYIKEKTKADIWTAQWFANEIDNIKPLTTGELKELYYSLEKNPDQLPVLKEQSEHLNWAERISQEERFFHWKLEFPDVFDKGGFDAVVGNPPWEVLKLKEREYFAGKDLKVYLRKKTNERRRHIEELKESNPELYFDYKKELEHYSSLGKFISFRKLFELTSKYELNTYQLFAELCLKLRKEKGRSGVIIPTGIATDKGNSEFFKFVVKNKLLYSLADFVNSGIFKNIDSRMRFSLIIFGKAVTTKMLFVLRKPEELFKKQFLKLSPDDILLVNPNTGTAPVFNSQKDMDLVLKIYRNNLVLLKENEDGTTKNPYGIKMYTQFHMSNDSDKFVREQELIDKGYKKNWIYYEKDGERYVPLCEGKTFYIMDSRYNHIDENGKTTACTAKEKSDPQFFPTTRYFIKESECRAFYSNKDWDREWVIAFRNIARSSDNRTFISSIMPKVGFGHSAPVVLFKGSEDPYLYFCSTCHIFDYVLRQKTQGTNMTFFILYQLPVTESNKFKELPGLDNGDSCLEDSVIRRLVKCVNYSYDMEPFVKDMGYEIEPRPWDVRERLDYMAQLDAIAAHLYGINYDDLKYIFTTFPIEKRNQEKEYETYLSRDLALKYFEEYKPILCKE